MKVFFQMVIAFIIGPSMAVGALYGAGAFIAWNWSWAATSDSGARFVFVLGAVLAAVIGFVGGASAACALD